MRSFAPTFVALTLLLAASCPPARAADAPPPAAIDWERARQLHQRERRGERLAPDDQAYLDRAKAERQRARPGGAAGGAGAPATPPKASTGLVPLTDKADQKYKGQTLGLYGDNRNEPPPAHLAKAMDAAKRVEPLDSAGKPAADGRVVLMSVGMSNTTQEFSRFVDLARADAARSPKLTIVDAAQGGRAADDWASKDRPATWEAAEQRLKQAGATPAQVQVLWIKQAEKGPARLGEFPRHAEVLRDDLRNLILIARERYPNLRLVYLSSRTYGGWAQSQLNPEPYAYESAFSVQWLIRGQADATDPALAYDKVPVLLWGPYLWTDGTAGRKADALKWDKADTASDGTHPSPAGRQKVADQLLTFFKTEPTARAWFTGK